MEGGMGMAIGWSIMEEHFMKNGMMKSYEVDGEKLNLASFGIKTLSYFQAADNEKGLYHIDGDTDDSAT